MSDFQTSPAEGPIQIDVDAILRQRLGRRRRWIPNWLVRRLARLIHQDQLNNLLRHNYPKLGAPFCEGVLGDLGVDLRVDGAELLPDPSQRRVVVVSNHPLGGLDGMTLIAWATRHWGGQVRFVVNDLLDAVEPLKPVFVSVNKHGAQSRDAMRELDDAFAGDDPLIIFPAGLVSRRHDDGSISDLDWKKMVVTKARAHRRDIVPVHFSGKNSDSFYNTARWRVRLGLKFNIEMILLPRELFRCAGTTFVLTCGQPIPWQQLRGGAEAQNQAQQLRQLVYRLPSTTK